MHRIRGSEDIDRIGEFVGRARAALSFGGPEQPSGYDPVALLLDGGLLILCTWPDVLASSGLAPCLQAHAPKSTAPSTDQRQGRLTHTLTYNMIPMEARPPRYDAATVSLERDTSRLCPLGTSRDMP